MAALNQSLLFQSHLKVNFCWSLIFLSFACIWTGCNSNQHVKSFSLDEVKSFIGRQNTQYNERFSASIPEALQSRYTTDACIFPPGQPRICGIPGITSFFYSNGENRGMKIQFDQIKILGNEFQITEEGEYKMYGKLGQLLDIGKFLTLWKKEGETWKIYREIWNTSEEKQVSNSSSN